MLRARDLLGFVTLARYPRARRVLRKARDLFPFTLLGLLILSGAGVATWFLGFERMDLVVLAMGTATLAVGALSLLIVSFTALGVWIALRRATRLGSAEGLRLECGAAVKTGFSIPSLWFVPLVDVRWTWLDPRAHIDLAKSKGRQREMVTAHRRGLVDHVVRRVEVTDAFHLTRIVMELRELRRVRALPSQGALKQVQVIRSLATGDDQHDPMGGPDGDRSDLRAYTPGDPVRFILWRVFAKTRQIVVRSPERAVAVARKAFAYLVVDDADEPAAGAARVVLESGTLGSDWAFGADGCAEHASTRAKALELLAQSAQCPEDARGAGLTHFLQRHVKGPARIVVFVPARRGPWLARVVAATRGRAQSPLSGPPIEFVVCTDGVVARGKKTWTSRLEVSEKAAKKDALTENPEPEGVWTMTDAEDLEAVFAALASTRARVRLADRRAGKVYDARAMSAMTAPAKARPARKAS